MEYILNVLNIHRTELITHVSQMVRCISLIVVKMIMNLKVMSVFLKLRVMNVD